VNVPLLAAGCLAVLAAAVHGLGGEVLVVRKLSPRVLPPSRFGGPRMTKAMIHVTWHVATLAFLTLGCALLASASVVRGDAEDAIGVVAAAAFTGFAVLGIGLGAAYSPRSLLTHPGPAVFAATAALAWWGAL
jgi:hypothetical protein